MRPLRTRTEKDALNVRLEGPTGRTKKVPGYFFNLFFIVIIVQTSCSQLTEMGHVNYFYQIFCLKTNSNLTLSFFTDKNTVILPNFSRYWYIGLHRYWYTGLHRLFQHQCSDTNQHTPNTKISNNACQCFICPKL